MKNQDKTFHIFSFNKNKIFEVKIELMNISDATKFEAYKRALGAKERKVTRCYLQARGQWQPSAVEVGAIGEEPMPAGSGEPEITFDKTLRSGINVRFTATCPRAKGM